MRLIIKKLICVVIWVYMIWSVNLSLPNQWIIVTDDQLTLLFMWLYWIIDFCLYLALTFCMYKWAWGKEDKLRGLSNDTEIRTKTND